MKEIFHYINITSVMLLPERSRHPIYQIVVARLSTQWLHYSCSHKYYNKHFKQCLKVKLQGQGQTITVPRERSCHKEYTYAI